MKLNPVTEDTAHYLYPNHCSFCKTKLLAEKEMGVCLQCIYKLPKTNNFDQRNNLDEILLAGRFPFQCAASFSFFTKEGLLQALIHDLKYNNKPHIGHLVGALFGADRKSVV